MTLPQTPPPVSDDELVRSLTPITFAYCGALLLVGLLGALVLVPDPTVTPTGLLIGAGLGLAAWFVPALMIPNRLRFAARQGLAPEQVPGVVRTVVWIGISFATLPAMLGLVVAVSSGHDVGALVFSVPLAMASLVLNVSGPRAVRRHLERARSTVAS
ncbi:hypothetical protein [Cellulomonas sp. P5_C6]